MRPIRRKMTARTIAPVLLAALFLGSSGLGPDRARADSTAPAPGTFEQSKQYAACMLLARDHPQDAYDSAGTWLTQNGGARRSIVGRWRSSASTATPKRPIS